MSAWETLGIAATPEEGAIRRAYAARVRQWRPDTHPQEFARLREAYEHALRWARMAVQEQAGDEEDEDLEHSVPAAPPPAALQPQVAARAAPQPARPAPAPMVQQPSATSVPVAPGADLPLPQAPPSADALIRELAQCFSADGDIEAIGLLRKQYALVSAHTIDTRLDWEQVLLASLLGAQMPPLALVFEGDRLLEWRERHADVVQMFGHEDAERLRLLLDLAHETTYLRFFSPNLWQRRVFGAARVPWIGMTVQLEVARHSVGWWRKLAEDAGRPALHELLDARVLRRVAGLLLLSTDVLLGLLLAGVLWAPIRELGSRQPWMPLALAGVVFALVLPLPLLGRWLWNTPLLQRVRGWRDTLEKMPFALRALALGVLLTGAAIGLDPYWPLGVRIAAGAVLGATGSIILVTVLVGLWYVLRFGEQLLSLPWLWLQRTWGLHAFHSVVGGRGVPTWRDQLGHLPGALAIAWRARRARRKAKAEQERQARQLQPPAAKGQFNYWWIFWAIVALQVLGRLAK